MPMVIVLSPTGKAIRSFWCGSAKAAKVAPSAKVTFNGPVGLGSIQG